MSERELVLVIGPGRSGTSSVAGAFASSGFHVPRSIGAREANPRGFFEPRWVVNLHKRLLGKAGVATLDTDPAAGELAAAVHEDPEVRAEVRSWLAERLATNPRLVLKDPRMTWFQDLWVEAARALGIEPGIVIMLRHPAEVSASRGTHYDSDAVRAVAGWSNVILQTEEASSGLARKVVHYPDLLTGWRHEMGAVGDRLGLDFDPPLHVEPHPIGEHLDPSLRREDSEWDAAVPEALRDLAGRIHHALLRVSRGEVDVAGAGLEALRVEYAELYDLAITMTHPEHRREVAAARRRAVRQTRRELPEQRRVNALTRRFSRRTTRGGAVNDDPPA